VADDTLIVFAPGAGAPSSSPWMRRWTALLGRFGTVAAFDYPYAREGRRAPDRLPLLIAAHKEAIAEARRAAPRAPRLVLAGKSMGSRVGCHVSLTEPVAGLVCLGYPLRGAGPRAALRDEVLRALAAPVLFVQGTRDRLCGLGELDSVRARMRARSELHVVEGGDHSLAVPRSGPISQEDADERALAAIGAFLGALA
jgi:predicted alpha/beta-hydrolase family hydrolase